jgi:hypothetical protein
MYGERMYTYDSSGRPCVRNVLMWSQCVHTNHVPMQGIAQVVPRLFRGTFSWCTTCKVGTVGGSNGMQVCFGSSMSVCARMHVCVFKWTSKQMYCIALCWLCDACLALAAHVLRRSLLPVSAYLQRAGIAMMHLMLIPLLIRAYALFLSLVYIA